MTLSIPTKLLPELVKVFQVSFASNEEKLRIWIRFQLNVNLYDIKQSRGFEGILFDVFDWVESQGFQMWETFLTVNPDASSNYPMLCEQCTEVLSVMKAEAAERLRSAGLPRASGGRDLLIWNSAPFVNRTSFWIAIDELLTSELTRIVMLSGERKSGSSYCGVLLQHVARRLDEPCVLIDLQDEQTSDISSQELCRRLVLKLRIGPSHSPPQPLPGQKPDRYARDLAAWMSPLVPADKGERTWIVLDHFEQEGVPEDTHDFITALATEAIDHPRLRLVLLAYNRTMSSRVERAVRRNSISHVTASDIDQYLRQLNSLLQLEQTPGWPALQEFLHQYQNHPPGSRTQIYALSKLFPQLVSSALAAKNQAAHEGGRHAVIS